jgi:sulfonate transport system substrate-binding protein
MQMTYRKFSALLGWLPLAIIACAGAVLGLATSATAEPVKIRASWVAVPNNLPPILFKKEGIAKHLGKSYTFEAVRYRGTPQTITALATGDLEMGLLSYTSFPLAIENAKMNDLRIIADEFQDGVEGYYSGEFMVLKDGPVKKIEDLKGKVVAVNVKGGATHGAVRAILGKHGLHDNDYTVLEVSFSNMRAVLAEKKADLISVGIPQFSWDPALQKIGRPLFTQKDAFGRTDVIFWVARSGFLTKNRAAVTDFFEDMLRMRKFYFNPANHKEAVKVVSDFTKAPPERLDSWLFSKRDYYRDPNARVDIGALQKNIDQLHKVGSIKQPLNVKKYVDQSYLEEAIKRVH